MQDTFPLKIRRLFLGPFLYYLYIILAIYLVVFAVEYKPFLIAMTFLFLFVIKLRLRNLESQSITNTQELDYRVNEIFNNAKTYLAIVSPYFHAGENRLKSIINAKDSGCEVVILVNKRALISTSTQEELIRLQNSGCQVFVNPNLHSKIYMNEKELISGSINLVKGSFDNSLEFGVYTKEVENHNKVYEIVYNDYLKSTLTEVFDAENVQTGYCIKTKTLISYNPKSPIERNEYLSNVSDRNGKFCHKCGKDSETSVAKPLCMDCK